MKDKSRRPVKPPLADAQLVAVARLFSVLSEPTRLKILQLLEAGPAAVGEIVERLDLKQANASKQLGILHDAGIVARARDGNLVRYSIRMPLVFDLCEIVCTGLREEAAEQLRLLSPSKRK